jgi:exocyst complex component 4
MPALYFNWQQPAFRFADTDMRATNKALKPHEDGLTRALKDTMPGLAPGAGGDPSQTIISSATDERLLGSDQHHRLLIRPDAFHVTVLFQPTLCFMHRIAEILPNDIQTSQTSNSGLDDFVLKVYLPQLEEKVLDIFHHAVTGSTHFRHGLFF